MRSYFLKLFWRLLPVLIGIGGTLLVQAACRPAEIAAVDSPDGKMVLVVERKEPWFDPPYRVFHVYYYGQNRSREDVDGATYMEHEYMSGGIDMTEMKTYWRGETAVAEFREARLERAWNDDQWKWYFSEPATITSQPSPASTQPTSQP